ncbi:MAG: HNH endonuclease [Candidatus Cloacimonetes bacterium]|nr:HNH endonuclease [Candidatus Cloacimonadota bacterium]
MQKHLLIHQKLVQAVKNLRKNEAEILDLIAQADQTRDFLMLMQYPSLFSYCVKGIGLTDAEAYNFLALYKKSKEIPALTEAIQSGEVSVSKLRHICPVINQENQTLWIDKAKSETNKKLIDEVAKVSPYTKKREVVKPAGEGMKRLSLDVSPELIETLLRLQEVLKLDNFTQVIEVSANETLEKKDPIKKAERAEARAKKKEAMEQGNEAGKTSVKETEEIYSDSQSSVQENSDSDTESVARQERKKLPTHLVHAVNRRDRGQCCYYGMRNNRCDSRYRVEIHHIEPISRGGKDTIENLVTLCHDHHKLIHESLFGQGFQKTRID